MVKTALGIIDPEWDFIDGSLPVPGALDTLANLVEMLASWNGTCPYDFLFVSKDWHDITDNNGHFSDTPDFVDTWPTHCIAETHGSQIPTILENWLQHYGAVTIYKGMGEPAYSAFQGFDHPGARGPFTHTLAHSLNDYLYAHAIDSIELTGYAGDYCVRQTALDAARYGYEVFVHDFPYTASIADDGVAKTREMLNDSNTN